MANENDVLIINNGVVTGYKEGAINVEIPAGVTEIGGEAFIGCKRLRHLSFTGTMEQWKAVQKGESWNTKVRANFVKCSDGEAAL